MTKTDDTDDMIIQGLTLLVDRGEIPEDVSLEFATIKRQMLEQGCWCDVEFLYNGKVLDIGFYTEGDAIEAWFQDTDNVFESSDEDSLPPEAGDDKTDDKSWNDIFKSLTSNGEDEDDYWAFLDKK